MAGTRVEKIGTIFSRVTGMIRAGVKKWDERPIWYDIYSAFPPKQEPKFDRPVNEKEVKKLVYPEDIVRAKYQNEVGEQEIITLDNPAVKTTCDRFIDAYKKKLKNCSPEKAFMDARSDLSFHSKLNMRR